MIGETAMKKFFSIIFSIILTLSITACNSTTSKSDKTSNSEITEKSNENTVTSNSETTEKDNENTVTSNKTTDEPSFDDRQWKQFLKNYGDWIDRYIEILEKYTNDPTDITVIADYTKMLAELSEWQTKSDEIQKELEEASPTELAEYTSELLKIVARIAEKTS